jgi:hypothetical protein
MNAPAHPIGTTRGLVAAYRQLIMRGLAPGEAANVTAIMTGLPLGDTAWTVHEISHALFLRTLREGGRFGPDDGAG